MLTRDDLIEIADRYHRTNWDGFDPTTAVLDIGRLLGHITLQAERIAALDAAARTIVDGCRGVTIPASGVQCRWCDNAIAIHGHRPTCPAGIVAALLKETTP